jgi:hypothetical protein
MLFQRSHRCGPNLSATASDVGWDNGFCLYHRLLMTLPQTDSFACAKEIFECANPSEV